MSAAAGVTRRAPWLLLALCLALGAGFRWYHLDRQTFWYDEMFTRFWATGRSWSDIRESVPATEVSASQLLRVLALPRERGPRDVIRAITRDDPQHTPLYYLLAHGWIRMFGDSVWTLRALSVLIGLLTLPGIYWLARELGLSIRIAQVAAGLASVSPFFVIYSQEARQYMLWGAEVIVSSALLMRAMRRGRFRDWIWYGMATAAGLYTHLLFVTVMAAHTIVVVASRRPSKESANSSHASVAPFLGVTALAVVGLLPWLAALFASSERAVSHLGWSTGRVGTPYLSGMWAFNYSSLFVDANHSVRFVERPDLGLALDYAFRSAALVLIGIAVFFVWRRVAGLARWFILALISVPFLSLAIPDLLLGGIRSGGGHRYLFPSYIGIVLAVACLLGDDTPVRSRWMRTRAAALCGIVGCSLVSLMVHATAPTWWTKPVGYHLPGAARLVNQTPNPLLVSRVTVNLLSMSTLLKPNAHVLPIRDVAGIAPRRGYSAILVLEPPNGLLAQLRSQAVSVAPVDRQGQLWQILR
jgi:uncharacterized membrane protein